MKLSQKLWMLAGVTMLWAAPALGQTAAAGATAAPAGQAEATAEKPVAAPPAPAPGAPPAPATPATGASPAPGGTTSPAPAAAPAAMDGATYVVRLRDLEQRIDELKEQIRRSHTRLSLLSDTILSGGVGGARAEIKFTNEMSSAFRLTKALFLLDGAVQYNKQDESGTLAAQKEIPIFTGSIPPGDHLLQVSLKLQGHGYGVFSYLRGYNFEVKSQHSFTVTHGKTVELTAVAYEKGDVTTPLEERPGLRFTENIKTSLQDGAPAPAAPPPSSGTTGASGNFSVGTGGQ